MNGGVFRAAKIRRRAERPAAEKIRKTRQRAKAVPLNLGRFRAVGRSCCAANWLTGRSALPNYLTMVRKKGLQCDSSRRCALRAVVGGVVNVAFRVVHDLEADLATDVQHGLVFGEHLAGDAG